MKTKSTIEMITNNMDEQWSMMPESVELEHIILLTSRYSPPPYRHLKEKFREKLGKCKRDGIIQGLVSKGLSRGAGGTNDVDDEENNIISE